MKIQLKRLLKKFISNFTFLLGFLPYNPIVRSCDRTQHIVILIFFIHSHTIHSRYITCVVLYCSKIFISVLNVDKLVGRNMIAYISVVFVSHSKHSTHLCHFTNIVQYVFDVSLYHNQCR